MTLPNPDTAKDYPRGKSTEELKTVPQTAVGWRVSLTCDQLKVEGEAAVVTVYHLRGGEYHPVRQTKLIIPKGGLKNKDGTDATEWFIGGEYPFEFDGFDPKDGKPLYRYFKADEIKIEIDAKIDIRSEVKIAPVERQQIRRLLPGVPERELSPEGRFKLE